MNKILGALLVLSLILFSCGEYKKENKKSKKEETEKKADPKPGQEEAKIEEPKVEAIDCACFTSLTEKHTELSGYLSKADAKEVVFNENLNAAIHNILMDIRNLEKECHADKSVEDLITICDNYQGYAAAKAELKEYQELIDTATK